MIEVGRRRFLSGLVGLVAAPAVVKVTSLMPIKAWSKVYGRSPAQEILFDVREFNLLYFMSIPDDILVRPINLLRERCIDPPLLVPQIGWEDRS